MNDHRSRSVTLAVFGFSGLATKAVGEPLVVKECLFWPSSVELPDREIGIYICKLSYKPSDHVDALQENTETDSCDPIALSDRTLKRFLR